MASITKPPAEKAEKSEKLENWKTGKLENWKTGKLVNWKTGKLRRKTHLNMICIITYRLVPISCFEHNDAIQPNQGYSQSQPVNVDIYIYIYLY
ncbi:hypothetical protein BKA91DRAFT_44749 [Yarrowia lipolytica]|nr:hypothetical protein BKA91DRAFT_44749 [Yarrowia lipolytica]KAE8172799.1 hypothetical protein BKA90DRAFT_14757 [Yarrowia lipolytica]RMI94321.1 hypothetical protein BD777DRAFT_26326 [Yarrowia lipolytica]